MASTVYVQCLQGIDQLIALGRFVAERRAWATHPQAREAIVGLWLDVQLTRADLRGSAEVTNERVQGAIESTPASPDARSIDAKLAGWCQELENVSVAAGDTQSDVLTLNVALPSSTGAWGLVVTVAVIAAAAGVTGVLGWRGIDAWLAKVKGDQEMQSRAQETGVALQVSSNMKAESRSTMNEAERAVVETARQRQLEATKNLTATPPHKGLFGDLSGQDLATAGIAIALLYFLSRLTQRK